MRQLIAALLFFSVAAPAATERDVAEWTLRWEGSLILEGSNKPIRDLSELPPGDFHISSIDLTAAYHTLGEVTGETASEDLLERIFSEFCIGK